MNFFRSSQLILLGVNIVELTKFNPTQVKNKLCTRVLGA